MLPPIGRIIGAYNAEGALAPPLDDARFDASWHIGEITQDVPPLLDHQFLNNYRGLFGVMSTNLAASPAIIADTGFAGDVPLVVSPVIIAPDPWTQGT